MLLSAEHGNQATVANCCPIAARAGVHRGISVALAEALAPGIYIAPYDPAADCRALIGMAHRAIKFAPLVGIDREVASYIEDPAENIPPSHLSYGIILNISGTERYHGGEENLAARIAVECATREVVTRIGIAQTIGAAWALSRYGKSPINISNSFDSTLGELPIGALRIPEDTIIALKELGIVSIYDLLALPRPTLASRFGEIVPQRIRELLGTVDEPLTPLTGETPIAVSVSFEVPLTYTESITRATLTLLEKLLLKLSEQKKRAGRFIITMESLDMEYETTTIRKEISLFSAQRNFAHIASVVTPILESIRSPQGIRAISVTGSTLEHAPETQIETTGERRIEGDAGGELMNHLVTTLGRERVTHVHFVPSYIPERSFTFKSVESGYSDGEPEGECVAQERPPYFLASPERIAVVSLLPDKPPTKLSWLGESLFVLRGVGPEKISAEWWHEVLDPDSVRERDYFRIQDETGRWLWVFRVKRTMDWYVQGVWV